MAQLIPFLENLPDADAQPLYIGQMFADKRFETVIRIYKIEGETYYFEDLISWTTKEFRGHYGSGKEEKIRREYMPLPGNDLDKVLEIGAKIVSGEIKLSDYDSGKEDVPEAGENAVMGTNSKGMLKAVEAKLQAGADQLKQLEFCARLEMERQKQGLAAMKRQMEGMVMEFKNKLEKVQNLIATIELYLGINEEIIQFQEGKPAEQSEPIVFCQLVLFMDEEVGDEKDGGLDFQDIETFRTWLKVPANLQQVMPYRKGMVAFKPRRYAKGYGGYDPMLAAHCNRLNRMTYFLIRNGENLYQIDSENIAVGETMFPRKSELAEIQEAIMKAGDNVRKIEEAKEHFGRHFRLAILFQGLIDRTEVFYPLPGERLNIFAPDAAEGKVVFLYDAESVLPDGRLRFSEWHKQINESIQEGSRVVCAFGGGRGSKDRHRMFKYYNDYSLPPGPDNNIYTVEETDLKPVKEYWQDHKEGKTMSILYNPGDTVYGSWGDYDPHERKKRLRWAIYKSDEEVLHYDQIDLSDVEFYLTNRIDRKNYLDMMPVLKEIKKRRLYEMQREIEFCKMIAGETGVEPDAVLNAVEWWKLKNKWKRPLDKDDAKAWRMVKAKVLREKK